MVKDFCLYERCIQRFFNENCEWLRQEPFVGQIQNEKTKQQNILVSIYFSKPTKNPGHRDKQNYRYFDILLPEHLKRKKILT